MPFAEPAFQPVVVLESIVTPEDWGDGGVSRSDVWYDAEAPVQSVRVEAGHSAEVMDLVESSELYANLQPFASACCTGTSTVISRQAPDGYWRGLGDAEQGPPFAIGGDGLALFAQAPPPPSNASNATSNDTSTSGVTLWLWHGMTQERWFRFPRPATAFAIAGRYAAVAYADADADAEVVLLEVNGTRGPAVATDAAVRRAWSRALSGREAPNVTRLALAETGDTVVVVAVVEQALMAWDVSLDAPVPGLDPASDIAPVRDLALSGALLAVAGPRVVQVYHFAEAAWHLRQSLTVPAGVGAAALADGLLVVGAPAAAQGRGAYYVYALAANATSATRLCRYYGTRNSSALGSTVALQAAPDAVRIVAGMAGGADLAVLAPNGTGQQQCNRMTQVWPWDEGFVWGGATIKERGMRTRDPRSGGAQGVDGRDSAWGSGALGPHAQRGDAGCGRLQSGGAWAAKTVKGPLQ